MYLHKRMQIPVNIQLRDAPLTSRLQRKQIEFTIDHITFYKVLIIMLRLWYASELKLRALVRERERERERESALAAMRFHNSADLL